MSLPDCAFMLELVVLQPAASLDITLQVVLIETLLFLMFSLFPQFEALPPLLL